MSEQGRFIRELASRFYFAAGCDHDGAELSEGDIVEITCPKCGFHAVIHPAQAKKWTEQTPGPGRE